MGETWRIIAHAAGLRDIFLCILGMSWFWFVGATYLEAEVDLTGSISFDTPGGPEGDTTTISFLINQQNKDRWNYLIGFNWELNRNWAITAEGGFGGSRENFIGGITYRW